MQVHNRATPNRCVKDHSWIRQDSASFAVAERTSVDNIIQNDQIDLASIDNGIESVASCLFPQIWKKLGAR